jgi:hypothetical protein
MTGENVLAAKKGRAMCDKCVEIDKKIEHFHRIAARMTDKPLLDGIRELVDQAKMQKATLHPERTP